jgi:uncharacterized protein YkwD
MKYTTFILIFVLLFSSSYSQYGFKFTQEEIQKILNVHNEARANITDSVTPLPPMKWNTSLETTAFNWVSKCIKSHNSGRATVGFHRVGENIYGQSFLI